MLDQRAVRRDQRADRRDIRQVSDAVLQIGRDPGAFRFRDLTGLGKIGVRIFRHEIERLLHDAGDPFAVPIGDGEQAEIVAFTQEGIDRGHVATAHDRAAPDGEKEDDDQHHGKD